MDFESELDKVFEELIEEAKDGDKGNPWAICHAQLGPKKTEKFERCVKKVKKKTGYKD